MQLQTFVDIGEPKFSIGYADNIISIGSCFADNIGNYLKESLFNIAINPYGVMYNPASVLNTLNSIAHATHCTEEELLFANGLYHSMQHHGSLSKRTAIETVNGINEITDKLHAHWQRCTLLLITFGTAWVYQYKVGGNIVANCHKLNPDNFDRRALTTDEIANMWIEQLNVIKKYNPDIKVIFTVSPIRHWKDGAHGNQLSKASLLLAIDKIVKSVDNCDYFPAYEIMMDELRDYRFYAEDMLHPSKQAVTYIRERFCEHYMDQPSLKLIQQAERYAKLKEHRALHPNTDEWQKFCAKRDRVESELKREIEKLRNNGSRQSN